MTSWVSVIQHVFLYTANLQKYCERVITDSNISVIQDRFDDEQPAGNVPKRTSNYLDAFQDELPVVFVTMLEIVLP
jgi:hypothetical protein